MTKLNTYKTWADFYSYLVHPQRTAKEKGDAFEKLTLRVLQRHPEYQSKLKNVWLLSEVPAGVRKKLKLPVRDEGIDLIAETVDGDYWAIQCKFKRDPCKAVTRTNLATFAQLAFAHCQHIRFGLVFHASDYPIRKLNLLGATGSRGKDFFDQLSDEDWSNIVAEKPKAIIPRKPRKHQKDAVQASTKHYSQRGVSRGKLIMPCGTGKSLTAFWVSEALEAKKILVAVPSLSLIKQSIADWTREFVARGIKPDWLVICSDETAAKREKDEFTESIGDLGIDATTNPARIQAFLKKRSGVKIVFSTYQSGSVLAKEALKQKFSFDLGIFDEAHRTVGVEEKLFSHLLSDKNISIKNRLFMTATERVVRGSKDDVYSMDDQSVYGDCFYQMTFKQAIEADPPIICDYKIITVSVTDAEVEEMIHNRHFVSVEGMKDDQRSDALVAAVAINKVIRKFGAKHLISFHRSIQAADSFKELQSEVFEASKQKISTFHISSKKSTGERASLINEFRDAPRALITNARCLQEGVDIPAVDTVVFADPKQSVVDIVQAAGRAMRRFEGKKFGMIVLPLPVPDKVDPEAFFEGTEFRQIARVITALSTQDQRIVEEFRVGEQQPRGKSKIVEMDFDLPLTEKIGLEDFSRKVFLKVWEKVGRVNWRPFEEARAFVRSLSLYSFKEYRKWSGGAIQSQTLPSRPCDIPTNPQKVYQSAFIGWGDFLGTGKAHPGERSKKFFTFERARQFVRSKRFSGQREFREWCRQVGDERIPAAPDRQYANKGWTTWGDFFGTGFVQSNKRKFRSYIQAEQFVRRLNLTSESQWRVWANSPARPQDIPYKPDRNYAGKGWKDWGVFLGTFRIADGKRVWRDFERARSFVKKQKLSGEAEWRRWSKSPAKPDDVPASPTKVYKNKGWISWPDWLGKED